MTNILLVSRESASLADLAEELSKSKRFKVAQVKSGEEALCLAGENRVEAVIAAEILADGPALPFVKELMKKYPLINCAMVSSLSPEEYHELTEGLGLFMQLSVNPGAEEASRMIQFLDFISVLMDT